MGAPQVLVIVLLCMRVAVHAALDKQPREGTFAYYSFGSAFFNAAVMAGLLWWGGFFG